MDTNAIRDRLKGLGYSLLEIPVRHSDPDPSKRTISRWKVVASKPNQSCEVSGQTLDEAIRNVGLTLGVIPKE